tara:strand:+ start:267 stop:623 length:357 start_codon:yes stop_codon:yes gene_type:complete
MVEGGCFCGSVRYKFKADDYLSANCHCSICRRISGAAFVSWLAIPSIYFNYTKNNPKKLVSSSHGTRYFCKDCGTPLVCILDEDKKNIYVTICSLDKPQNYEPKDEIYLEDMLDWLKK